jgi:hypothetical protein
MGGSGLPHAGHELGISRKEIILQVILELAEGFGGAGQLLQQRHRNFYALSHVFCLHAAL